MSNQQTRSSKRARGSYAKLICFQCRERRIKCFLPDGVEPSSKLQPLDTSCERCRRHGLDCIVRKTTLGRPNSKREALPTPSSTEQKRESRSTSPHAEELVLLDFDQNDADANQSSREMSVPRRDITSVQLIRAVNRTFDFTNWLLARDHRFGSSLPESRNTTTASIQTLVSNDLARVLDDQ